MLVNNAGVMDQQNRLDEMTTERIRRILDINTFGSILCAREAVKRMSTKQGGKGGAIVNVSSRASELGSAGEYVHYAASKAAVDTLTIGLAREVAQEGMRVNAVNPGLTLTDRLQEGLITDARQQGIRAVHGAQAVRVFARELGVDLNLVTGTERGGRIIKNDIQKFVKAALAGTSTGSETTACV